MFTGFMLGLMYYVIYVRIYVHCSNNVFRLKRV